MRHIRALPVLMYHSVAPPGSLTPHQWLEWISVSVDLFEATLMDWDQRGVRTVGSEEFRGFLDGRFRLPRNRVVLTFDDGYLDNWVAVTPLLERYGQKAIVFITTDFIDPSGELRPTIKESPSPVKWQGYLSIPELRAMAASGHIEIQSHAMTHTWEFVSPEIVDFYGPHLTMDQVGCDYRFLWLNRNRALKPFALQHLRREAVAWGTPVYRFAPALVARRYRPDPDIETKLVETVAREGGKEFFRRTDWRAHLERLVEDHRRRFGDRGSYETEEERRARICNELHGSRTFLEQLIGQPVRFLAPPQGGSNEETLILARKCGYDLVTAPGTAGVRLNHPGAGRGWVHRCSTGYNLFGRRASLSTSLRSQRIVLARYSGEAMAMAITKAVGAYRRLRGAGKRARQLTASGE